MDCPLKAEIPKNWKTQILVISFKSKREELLWVGLSASKKDFICFKPIQDEESKKLPYEFFPSNFYKRKNCPQNFLSFNPFATLE